MNITSPLVKLVNSPSMAHIAQTTSLAVSVETGLKAIGRPMFTMMDKKTDLKSRQFSAVKEFIYQSLCLAFYLSIIPLFKMGGFKIAKKIFGNQKGFQKFDTFKDFVKYVKLVKEKDLPRRYNLVRGSVELTSIIGSVMALTMVAPYLAHKITNPIMKAIGMENLQPGHKKGEVQNMKSEYSPPGAVTLYRTTSGRIVRIKSNMTNNELNFTA